MWLYIEAVDDSGETVAVFETMPACESCKYFECLDKKAFDDPYRCDNPYGLKGKR